MRRALVLACALLLLCARPALATPGGTDGDGGHYDSKTGEYHYHHGYPAHQHINGACTYDLNFTSSVVTGREDPRFSGVKSEDVGDAAVARRTARIAMPFAGIPARDRTGLVASSAALALVALGGLLSTVGRRKKD